MDYTIDTFDWEFYINEYKDLRDAGILTKEKAWWHWSKYGKNENRLNRKIWKNTDIDVINKINNVHKNISKPFNIYELKEKKIVINSHSDLNLTGGDTIMLSNTINHLMKNKNIIILLTTTELKDDLFIRNLENNLYSIITKNNDEIISALDDLSKNNDHILIRNTQLLNKIKNKSWLAKTSLYCVGNDTEDIKNLDGQYNSIITQSETLKTLYKKNCVNENQILIKAPIAYKYEFDLPERTDNEIRLVYCGTLRDEENILEIIEEFQKIHKERPEVLLKIVYGKIHGDKNFKDKVNEFIKNGGEGVTFKHNLSHRDACYEIATSDIGICWRKNGWGDNGEVSTKVKEYELYNLRTIKSISFFINRKKKFLFLFSNIYTSNASSIMINSLINKIKVDYDIYIIDNNYKLLLEEDIFKPFDKFINDTYDFDTHKKSYFLKEVKNFNTIIKNCKENNYNGIFTWSNPYITSYIGCALSKKFNIHCCCRLGDFYVSEYSKIGLNWLIIAKSIVVPNKILQQKVIEFYGKKFKHKIKVIPQHYYTEDIKNRIIKKDYSFLELLHSGNMYQERKIDMFIKILSKMKKNNKIKVKFIGCHDKLEDDKSLAKKYNVDCDFTLCYPFKDWSFSQSIPFEKIRKYMINTDILIHIEYVTENNHFLSFKLIDYLSYNRPIITITQKNTPNYYLAKECGFAFGDIEDPHNLLKIFEELIDNPKKFIPDKNKIKKYHIDNISNKWLKEIINCDKMKNYEWINLLENNYDNEKVQDWIQEMNNKSYCEIDHLPKKDENLYTIWLQTTLFSESLIYSMQNLNYLGYKFKIVLNDNQCIGLNYMKNNTTTKYWFDYNDDFIMMKDSIEYMVMVKEKVKEPVCIFRLYDLNYGYKYKCKIDCFARCGIKIHDTKICKKFNYDNCINSDLFYKNLKKYGGYINYCDKSNEHYHKTIAPEKIVGYHELFASQFKIFCLFLKMGTKFKLYEQDAEIVWNFFILISENRNVLIEILRDLNAYYGINIKNWIIDECFNEGKMKSIIEKKPWLSKTKNWFDEILMNNIQIQKNKIINNLDIETVNKILGFLYGLEVNYSYDTETIKIVKNKYDSLKLNKIKISNTIVLNCDDINNLDQGFIDNYNNKKDICEDICVISKTPLVSLCDKIRLEDLYSIICMNKSLNKCLNKIKFYVTTTISDKIKREFSDNVINKKKFTPLVSIANTIKYYNIIMPNWENLSDKINNYAIWDLYRNSLEWLTYILDIGVHDKNEKYINFCIEVVNSWLSKFRLPGEYHSKLIWCDHAVSCRIIILLTVYNTFRDTIYLNKIKLNLIDELKTHNEFLVKWVIKNETKTHNHVLIACISLVYYNLYFNLNDHLYLSLNVIERYIESNFIDGINIENSPGYQFHVLVYLIRFFYFVTKLNKQNILTDKMKKTIEESIRYLDIFKRNNLTVPVIGDSNLTLDIFASYDEEYNNLDKMIDFLKEKKVIKNKDKLFDNRNFNSIIKKETGYVFFLEKDIQFIIRYNPLTYNWHTHNDQLSINYFRDGIDWITDVGSYPDKRDYCISRMAHNIVLRNMENKDTIKDNYQINIVNDKHIILKLDNNEFTHKREVIWEDIDHFKIIDDIENKDKSEKSVFNQIFHLNHNVEVEQNDNKVILSHNNHILIIQQENQCELKIYNGNEQPFIGWVCYNASKLEKTNTLVFNSEIVNKTKFITKFCYKK